MWIHNGALLCFLLSVFLMKIPESNAKFTDNLWMSYGNSSGITDGTCYEDNSTRLLCFGNGSATNTPEECKENCGSLGYYFAGVQNGDQCFCGNVEPPSSKIRDSSECDHKCPGDDTLNCGGGWRMNIYKTVKSSEIWSSMVEAIKERLENIPPKRDNTSELSMTLLKLDELLLNFTYCSAQDIMNFQYYNILEDLFLKIVENPLLDDHFPDFASTFANYILPTVIQSKNEDSPLLKSKLETPFPKPVDDSADPHEEIVTINGNYENCVFKDTPGEKCFQGYWYSTGLYAKQGQLIKVTVPENVVGKFAIQIGFADRTFEDNQEKWLNGENITRPGVIEQYYAEIKAETKLLSPYGGLIYINVAVKSQPGTFTLKFDKVITSPTFIEGKTTNEQWDKMLTSTKSPMTELEVPGLIVTIPKFHFENAYYNMERLSSRFTEVMQAFFDLQGYVMPIPHRYAYAYIKPGIGAHNGYPIMDFSANEFETPMELLELANGTDKQFFSSVWYIPHEIGHNIQNTNWTPNEMGEVTNEIFANYVNETVHNVNPGKAKTRNVLHYYDVFMLVRDECSWDTYKKFFKYYNEEIPQSMVPKNNDEKYSLMARVLSEKCNKNLIPFFKWFNWPILSDAEEATKNLPEWKGIIDRLENSSCTPDSYPTLAECACKNTTGGIGWFNCGAGYYCTADGVCKEEAATDFLKEKDTDFTVTEIGSEKTGEEKEYDGPDYLKEKDIDFTVTEIGSKKTDGDLEFANIE